MAKVLHVVFKLSELCFIKILIVTSVKMTKRPSVAVTDVTFASEIDAIAPRLQSVTLLFNVTRF